MIQNRATTVVRYWGCEADAPVRVSVRARFTCIEAFAARVWKGDRHRPIPARDSPVTARADMGLSHTEWRSHLARHRAWLSQDTTEPAQPAPRGKHRQTVARGRVARPWRGPGGHPTHGASRKTAEKQSARGVFLTAPRSQTRKKMGKRRTTGVYL